MYAIILLAILVALKLGEISIFAEMSWWWITGGAVAAFIWFEFIERMLGLDKRQEHAHYDRIQQERAKKNFDKDKKKRR